MFGIGIIGCGKIAQVRHIPEYAAHPEAKLVGFYDINQQRAAELAAKYGGRAYATVEELLAEPEIQAVSICAANFAHAELTIAALNAGKHVLCEKPMATNLADCEAMVQAADANGKFLMIGHNQRLAKAHSLARKLIVEGLIGDIITFRTIFGHGGPETWSIDPGKNTWFFDKNRAAMGAMADLGIHKTDLIQFLTGQRVIRTTARVTTLDKKDASGNLIGVAFQIQDDILDVTSTEEVLGKPIHSDEKNQKTTYVTLLGIEQAQKRVEELSNQAIDLLHQLSGENEYLEQLLIQLIHRDR